MTFNELYVLLEATGIPRKIIKSKKKLVPPYMVVCEGEQEYNGADLRLMYKEHSPHIELYTTSGDYTSAETLGQILITNNLLSSVSDEIQISGESIFVRYFYLKTQFDKI